MGLLFKGKKIVVTGGTGSIGSGIVKRVLSDNAKKVVVFSNDEHAQYKMEEEFDDKRLVFIIGDIRDEDRVNYAIKGTDIVFHAAALKHVDICEFNPSEAVTVNILGTKNIIDAASKENVKKVISISTDKAVNPTSVLGSTKLLAEKLISAESFHRKSNTVFSSVRFGNVLNSRGSIIPHIKRQIMKGGPVTLTHKKMKRYFMTREESVNLIISASKLALGGEVFVLKMPVILLSDLFETIIESLAPKYGYKQSDIKTKIIGMKPGEKLFEYLITDFEIDHVLETRDFLIIPPSLDINRKNKYPGAKKPKNIKATLEPKPLNKKQILSILGKSLKEEKKYSDWDSFF